MAKYKKCPRCELNWIAGDADLCEVCKAELGKASSISLIEDEEEEALYDEERVCPVCKVNYLSEGEDVCSACRAAQLGKKADKAEEDDDWEQYVDDADETVDDDDSNKK